ncbi:F-box domain-containing protein [Brazilian cedratvirus IHUMI]|uniref:F-box domain-containing protein n=1 Tax=Brazilian cedratvirus IHUMI TaxID=2126980 RepID=A0A2R8FEY1_9VIRU|nr:F-box domain-containing protein [Brazilian cedratvirus IHUMI]
MLLSREVLFVILQEVEVGNLFGLSLVDRELKQMCADKNLWKKIFAKEGLIMLEQSESLGSWILNYKNSLGSLTKTSTIMRATYSIIGSRSPFSFTPAKIVPDIDLNLIGNASMIHVPGVTNEDELQSLLLRRRLCVVDFTCPDCKTSKTNLQPLTLRLEESRGSFSMDIRESCSKHGKCKFYFCDDLTKEQVFYLVYKLHYYSLVKEDTTSLISHMVDGLSYFMTTRSNLPFM